MSSRNSSVSRPSTPSSSLPQQPFSSSSTQNRLPVTPSTSKEPKEKELIYADVYPTSEYPPAITWSVHNRIMRQAAAGLCFIGSFDTSTQTALELVTHLMSSYMITVCNSTKLNCEIAGRTLPIPTDVWVALVNLGLNVEALPEYMNTICTSGNLVIVPPRVQTATVPNVPLRVGKTRPHPPHVNEFFPPFPDPHTYIRTEISGEPDTSYEKVRELAAQRKRDTELSLVDFMLRVHPRTCLFGEYESRVKDEARLALHEKEREKDALRSARRQAKAVEQMKQDVKPEQTDEIMEEDFLEPSHAAETVKQKDPVGGSEDEMDFDLEETETSLVLKKIPAWCNVLDPSLESRPYLSALVSEELLDDESSEISGNSQQNQGKQDGEEQVYDNAFLRPPRMPAKGNFVQF